MRKVKRFKQIAEDLLGWCAIQGARETQARSIEPDISRNPNQALPARPETAGARAGFCHARDARKLMPGCCSTCSALLLWQDGQLVDLPGQRFVWSHVSKRGGRFGVPVVVAGPGAPQPAPVQQMLPPIVASGPAISAAPATAPATAPLPAPTVAPITEPMPAPASAPPALLDAPPAEPMQPVPTQTSSIAAPIVGQVVQAPPIFVMVAPPAAPSVSLGHLGLLRKHSVDASRATWLLRKGLPGSCALQSGPEARAAHCGEACHHPEGPKSSTGGRLRSLLSC